MQRMYLRPLLLSVLTLAVTPVAMAQTPSIIPADDMVIAQKAIAAQTAPALPAAPDAEPIAISRQAQQLMTKFIPLDKKHAPMMIVRGGEKTTFLPLPQATNTGTGIALKEERYYRLPQRQEGARVSGMQDAPNAGSTTENIDAIRRQAVLDAAGKLPTSMQPGSAGMPDAFGVKVTHGVEPAKARAEKNGIAAPSSTLTQIAPYGSKLQSSGAPKGNRSIAPSLREDAAHRANAAGNHADPLDILMKSAP